jgi:hypothetical protein
MFRIIISKLYYLTYGVPMIEYIIFFSVAYMRNVGLHTILLTSPAQFTSITHGCCFCVTSLLTFQICQTDLKRNWRLVFNYLIFSAYSMCNMPMNLVNQHENINSLDFLSSFAMRQNKQLSLLTKSHHGQVTPKDLKSTTSSIIIYEQKPAKPIRS